MDRAKNKHRAVSGNRRENLSKHDQQSTTGRQFGSRRRWLVIVISLLLLWLLLPAGLTLIARCLIRQDKLQPADVVVALSGDARCWRERQAAALYQQGLARRIVVGGVPYAWGMHTGEAARRYLVAQQIPAADVLVLKDTWNTRVEADLLIALMRAGLAFGYHRNRSFSFAARTADHQAGSV